MVTDFIDFLSAYPSKYHVIEGFKSMLVKAGFTELCLKRTWDIKYGGRYFTTRGGSSLIAFIVGDNAPTEGYRIIAAHSDTPTLRIKPTPEMSVGNMLKINTEVYGGAILYSWFDRPLSLAGRVTIATDNPLRPKNVLVDVHKPIGVIPSVAIHFNRQVNDSFGVHKQTDMSVMLQAGVPTSLNDILAPYVGDASAEILDYDLNFYDATPACVIGSEPTSQLINASRLDDLMMAYSAVRALCETTEGSGAGRMVCIFDNEEVGSSSKQGAMSPLLNNIFERIADQLHYSVEERQRTIYNSFLISADMAHALHCNHPELHDPVVRPMMNNGICIKINANQKYMTDGSSSAMLQGICRKAEVPYQMYVNRSDMPGGSTLGCVVTSQLDIHGVDIGCPMLGMHSIRETAGVKDLTDSLRLFKTFFCI